jgi:hypothetical protein
MAYYPAKPLHGNHCDALYIVLLEPARLHFNPKPIIAAIGRFLLEMLPPSIAHAEVESGTRGVSGDRTNSETQ